MLKISNIKLSPDQPESLLRSRAAQLLRVEETEITLLQITHKSVDARRKSDVHLVYGVRVFLRDEMRADISGAGITSEHVCQYRFPYAAEHAPTPPVLIVGAGPAGLFCALCLSRAGVRCTLIDRGRPVEQRQRDVSAFWGGGALNPEFQRAVRRGRRGHLFRRKTHHRHRGRPARLCPVRAARPWCAGRIFYI